MKINLITFFSFDPHHTTLSIIRTGSVMQTKTKGASAGQEEKSNEAKMTDCSMTMRDKADLNVIIYFLP